MAGGTEMTLLDTCAFLWIVNDYTRLSKAALKCIKKSHALYISQITVLEIAIKHKTGKLVLPTNNVLDWYNSSLEYWNITETPLNAEILINSTKLPDIHKDPFDRIIIATGKTHKARLITADKIIPQYPGLKVVW